MAASPDITAGLPERENYLGCMSYRLHQGSFPSFEGGIGKAYREAVPSVYLDVNRH
jgi:hypothetical protein